ncbi:MAG: DUF3014 domain-containing protein [Pseudomonadota bacterium]
MQADRGDRIGQESVSGRHNTQTIITAIAVLILAGGAYILMPGSDENERPAVEVAPTENVPAVLTPPEPVQADPVEAAPDIPEVEEVVEAEPEEPNEVIAPPPEPPTPEELDAALREAVSGAGIAIPEPMAAAYSAPFLLDRGVSALDQLARGFVPLRTLAIPRPTGRFETTREGATYRTDPAGYARYNGLVGSITALPTESLARFFHSYRDQLSNAYALLGYPAEDLDNTLIAALDGLIAAPVVESPPALVSKGALWAYEDPALEKASDLHKQLMRTGPENTRALQAWASKLRDALLNP